MRQDTVDPEILRQLAEDLAPEDLAEVVRHYVADSAAMLRAMANGRGEVAAWQRAAHRLAGGAGSVGAVVVEAKARALMDAPLPDDPAVVLADLVAAVAASCAALDALVGTER